jgi:DnaJ-class molecular chaperone
MRDKEVMPVCHNCKGKGFHEANGRTYSCYYCGGSGVREDKVRVEDQW